MDIPSTHQGEQQENWTHTPPTPTQNKMKQKKQEEKDCRRLGAGEKKHQSVPLYKKLADEMCL